VASRWPVCETETTSDPNALLALPRSKKHHRSELPSTTKNPSRHFIVRSKAVSTSCPELRAESGSFLPIRRLSDSLDRHLHVAKVYPGRTFHGNGSRHTFFGSKELSSTTRTIGMDFPRESIRDGPTVLLLATLRSLDRVMKNGSLRS